MKKSNKRYYQVHQNKFIILNNKIFTEIIIYTGEDESKIAVKILSKDEIKSIFLNEISETDYLNRIKDNLKFIQKKIYYNGKIF